MKNTFYRVANSTPIDRLACRVANQSGCVEVELAIDRGDVLVILARLQRKQRLLKFVLKVDGPTQHKNLIHRHKAGHRSKFREYRAVAEYVRNGENICRLNAYLSSLDQWKTERKRIGAIENAWKAEHPGWLWDGQKLIAPNGAMFHRASVDRHQ